MAFGPRRAGDPVEVADMPATRDELVRRQAAELHRLRRRRYALRRWWPVALGLFVIAVTLVQESQDDSVGWDVAVFVAVVVTAALATWVAIGSHRITTEARRWELADRTPQARALPRGTADPSQLGMWDERDDPEGLEKAFVARSYAWQREVRSVRGIAVVTLSFAAALIVGVATLVTLGEGDPPRSTVLAAVAATVVIGSVNSGAWVGDLLHRQRMFNLVAMEHQAWSARLRRSGVESARGPHDVPLVAKVAVPLTLLALVIGTGVSSPMLLAWATGVLLLALVPAVVALWRARRPQVLGLWSGTGTVLDHRRHPVVLRREVDQLVLDPVSSRVGAASFPLADVLGVEIEHRASYPGLPRAVFLLLRDDVVILRGVGVADDPALTGWAGDRS